MLSKNWFDSYRPWMWRQKKKIGRVTIQNYCLMPWLHIWYFCVQYPKRQPKKKKTLQPGCALENFCFKGWFHIAKLNELVDSQLVTSMQNRCHPWLSNIALIQISEFPELYASNDLCLLLESKSEFELSRKLQTPANDLPLLYILCFYASGLKKKGRTEALEEWPCRRRAHGDPSKVAVERTHNWLPLDSIFQNIPVLTSFIRILKHHSEATL